MFEKVNPSHPDKLADRIAGAIVDLAYTKNKNPKVACEVLLGHGKCFIINETDTFLLRYDVKKIVKRIANIDYDNVIYKEVTQDKHLSKNQKDEIRCGDNGIFKGSPVTVEQKKLTKIAKALYKKYGTDGKYIIDNDNLIICQSHAKNKTLQKKYKKAVINPIGEWTGGSDVDSGATNRKLGSDMGDAVTGGGLHGKDLSKADVSVNIYCHLLAQKHYTTIKLKCAIGDKTIDGKPYKDIVRIARTYIRSIGGFEKFAEWGLIH